MEIRVIYVGEDDWGRKTYQNVSNKRIYKDVDGVMHTTSKDGEPDSPFRKDVKIKIMKSFTNKSGARLKMPERI